MLATRFRSNLIRSAYQIEWIQKKKTHLGLENLSASGYIWLGRYTCVAHWRFLRRTVLRWGFHLPVNRCLSLQKLHSRVHPKTDRERETSATRRAVPRPTRGNNASMKKQPKTRQWHSNRIPIEIGIQGPGQSILPWRQTVLPLSQHASSTFWRSIIVVHPNFSEAPHLRELHIFSEN